MKYFEETTLPLIKFPIITLWGTYIKCCNFVSQNYQLIGKYINSLGKQSYPRLLELVNENCLCTELKEILSHL